VRINRRSQEESPKKRASQVEEEGTLAQRMGNPFGAMCQLENRGTVKKKPRDPYVAAPITPEKEWNEQCVSERHAMTTAEKGERPSVFQQEPKGSAFKGVTRGGKTTEHQPPLWPIGDVEGRSIKNATSGPCAKKGRTDTSVHDSMDRVARKSFREKSPRKNKGKRLTLGGKRGIGSSHPE